MKKKILVLGAGGFIGHHLVNKLKSQGHFVMGIDLKYPEYAPTKADYFKIGDLTDPKTLLEIGQLDELYQLAADMGGAGYIFSGENDANVMHNSSLINLNVVHWASKHKIKKLFYSSSACVYNYINQMNAGDPRCNEDSAYPCMPDSEYGWEKIFSERLYTAFAKNYNLNIRIARFHNIFGSDGAWNNGREKSPAAICRKVAEARDGGTIEIWGDGRQTRSFLNIDECLDGVERLMESGYAMPINIGSAEMISINALAEMVIKISGKKLKIKNVESHTLGVRGRNSDNALIKNVLGWAPSHPLEDGMQKLYWWVDRQVKGEFWDGNVKE